MPLTMSSQSLTSESRVSSNTVPSHRPLILKCLRTVINTADLTIAKYELVYVKKMPIFDNHIYSLYR